MRKLISLTALIRLLGVEISILIMAYIGPMRKMTWRTKRLRVKTMTHAKPTEPASNIPFCTYTERLVAQTITTKEIIITVNGTASAVASR